VGDVAQAAAFFSEAMGFDRMVWSYPGALFFGAGGYHHHLGTNTWAGNAAPPTPNDARLLEWTVELPDAATLDAVAASLTSAGYPADRDVSAAGAADVLTRDPWGTAVRLRAAGASAEAGR
jgi:catechol 2,3-dioxygenase